MKKKNKTRVLLIFGPRDLYGFRKLSTFVAIWRTTWERSLRHICVSFTLPRVVDKDYFCRGNKSNRNIRPNGHAWIGNWRSQLNICVRLILCIGNCTVLSYFVESGNVHLATLLVYEQIEVETATNHQGPSQPDLSRYLTRDQEPIHDRTIRLWEHQMSTRRYSRISYQTGMSQCSLSRRDQADVDP